jgi:hypothetical protein
MGDNNYCHFSAKNPDIKKWTIYEIMMGPIVQLFYDDYLQTWEIAIKDEIGGYGIEDGYQHTYRERFVQYFPQTNCDNMNEIFQTWDPSLSYQFVFTCDTIVLVSVFQGYVFIPHFMLFPWLRNINSPRYVVVDSMEELQQYYGAVSSNHELQGVVITSNETGTKTVLDNPSYHQHRECLHYLKSHLFQYLCFRFIHQVDAFMQCSLLPLKNVVDEYERQLTYFAHALYVACSSNTIKWSISPKYIRHVYHLLSLYTFVDERCVQQYFYSLSPVDMMAFFM